MTQTWTSPTQGVVMVAVGLFSPTAEAVELVSLFCLASVWCSQAQASSPTVLHGEMLIRSVLKAFNVMRRAVFDYYINTCPNQGSRTIRTEEAVLISMTYLQTAISQYGV